MIANVKVEGQTIKWPTGKQPKIAADSIEFVNFHFTFSSDWDGCVIVAQFTQNDRTYDKLLVDGKCDFPPEITEGMCSVSCFGYIPNDAMRATVAPLYFGVSRSGFDVNGRRSIPPTPDLYSQLIAYYDDIHAIPDAQLLQAMQDTGLIQLTGNEDGALYTDENGVLLIL